MSERLPIAESIIRILFLFDIDVEILDSDWWCICLLFFFVLDLLSENCFFALALEDIWVS